MSRRHIVSELELREWLRRNVRARRAAQGMTAEAACAGGKMSLAHWQRIEAGKCNATLTTMVKVSVGLGMHVVDLLGNPGAPPGGGAPTLGIEIKPGSAPTVAALLERLSVRVRALRLEQDLTLKVASDHANLYWRHWQKIEACEANVTLQTLVRLALALRVTPAELLAER